MGCSFPLLVGTGGFGLESSFETWVVFDFSSDVFVFEVLDFGHK